MATVIANATLASLSPLQVYRGHLVIEDEYITAVSPSMPEGQYEVYDAHGALVMPGNVCAHTHLYSALARGMPAPPRTPRNFPEILQYIWWRLDRALDEPSIRASALIGALDALKAGTTTLIDHHASPNCIDGSLDMLAEELSRVGVRGVLCYEVTDRHGRAGREAGLRENERFVREGAKRYPLMRGLVGAHASFTLEDETLDALAGIAQTYGVGVHIHVAEDVCDQEDSLRRCGRRVIDRLATRGIVRPESLLAHGVHLDGEELQLIGQRRSWLAHNCRSNLNNAVGRAPVHAFRHALCDHVALGTDGIDQDMFAESRTAYFRAREDSLNHSAEEFTSMLANGGAFATTCFGQPLGGLEPGALADLLVLDYNPPTPLTAGNLAWHWMFALTDARVRDVMVAGRWVVRTGVIVTIDEERVRAQAREIASALWRRMQDLPL
jgi:putative selenium metabolism protein SsnA